MHNLQTVFVVAENLDLSSGHYLFAVIGIIIGFLAFMRLIFYLFNKNNPPKTTKEKEQFVYGGCFVIVTGVMLAVITCASRENDWWASKKYTSKDYHVVEGYVQVTSAGDDTPNVSTADTIKVGNTYFTINSYDRSQCYNVTMNKGGVLKNGVYAKIYYADTPNTIRNNILRIDVDEGKRTEVLK